jgi:hypothetical protein
LKVEYKGKIYSTLYFPFFRIRKAGGYQIFGLRYPSGSIDKVIVSDDERYMQELRNYLVFLIDHYMMEDDDVLTPYAIRLKRDIYELFGE